MDQNSVIHLVLSLMSLNKTYKYDQKEDKHINVGESRK